MALKTNTKAPDFTLKSTNGINFTLSDYKGKYIVLYFYPKDFTPGCTKEACEFRDHFEVFKNINIPIFGISTDSIETHLKFIESYHLPFDLLADTEGEVSTLYKAKFPFLNITKRITYLIGPTGSIEYAFENLFKAEQHVNVMLKIVEKLT